MPLVSSRLSLGRTLAIVIAIVIALVALSTAPVGAQGGRVDGVVYDSLAGHPLEGALIQMLAAPPAKGGYTSTSDSLGRFHMEGVPPGSYIAGFLSPVLDTLGVTAPYVAVEVENGASTHFELAVPTAARLMRAICGASTRARTNARPDSAGMLVGLVSDAKSGLPISGGTAVLLWTVLTIDTHGGRQEVRQLPGATNESGWFAMCGLDPGDYRIRSEYQGRASGLVDIEIKPHEVTRVSLVVGSDSASASDTARKGGKATLSGTVLEGKRPVEGAQVSVDGASASATTNDRGFFSLGSLPDGTRMAEVRAIGYAPVRAKVELSAQEPRTISIVMDKKVNTLGAVTVFGKQSRRVRDLTGFSERAKNSSGRFLTATEIERAHALTACDLMRGVAGVRIEQGRFGCEATMRGNCHPTIYLDDSRFEGGLAALSSFVRPSDILGVEIYTSATAPPQFNEGCAMIVVWSR